MMRASTSAFTVPTAPAATAKIRARAAIVAAGAWPRTPAGSEARHV